MTFRLNLNTVDYSQEDSLKLLASLHSLRVSAYTSNDTDYTDKAEDIWSELHTRKQSDPDQFARIEELVQLADRGQLSEEDLECLEDGFLP